MWSSAPPGWIPTAPVAAYCFLTVCLETSPQRASDFFGFIYALRPAASFTTYPGASRHRPC